ncbi:MAG: CDP-alcohol phosphatidyltransferase family protein [Anaerolineae bacterium]|nr:MAG: CDP-alcohol phosphatidyltransferase family protein [Anaerolineae bacterium]
MEHSVSKKASRMTFTDMMRVRFKGVLDPIGAFFNRLGLMPNTMTILGLVGNAVGALFLLRGEMLIGGLLVLAMGPVDALDGTMARLRGEPTEFGAFVDSVTDRYSELVILGGLLLYYALQGNFAGVVLAYLAAAGSVLVSYTRARAQSLGKETKIGILTRLERYLVLAPSLVFNIPLVGLGILAVFSNITALQRIFDVRRQFRSTNGRE